MAILSKATGSSLEDMADASAEVANHLGDMPNKAEVVDKVMRQIAGQGKLGAIEVKDLARQMAKVAASGNFFKGGAAANIATLGVFAQEAKLEGGASSSTMAATSVSSFARALATPKTVKQWQAHGFANGAFTDASRSELMDPLTIVKNALRASSGANGQGKSNETTFGQLFGSAQAARAATGWQAVYNRAGGGDAGIKAVEDEFNRLKSAMLDTEEVQRAFKTTLTSSQSAAAIMNNKLDEMADSITTAVLPAFLKIAPGIEQGISSFANLLAQVTGAKREGAIATLDNVNDKQVKEDMRLLESTSKVDKKTGKKIYSQEALDVAKQHWAQRNAAIAELGTQVKTEGGEAAEAREQGKHEDGLRKLFGMETRGSVAERLNKQTGEDSLKLQAAQRAADDQTRVLGEILRAINTGNAIAQSTGGTPPPGQGGKEPANAAPPE
jgi:hypothetical protein